MVKAEKYTYNVAWSEADGAHVGSVAEFPSLSWLAKSAPEALRGITQLVAGTLAEMGPAAPKPLSLQLSSDDPLRAATEVLQRAIAVSKTLADSAARSELLALLGELDDYLWLMAPPDEALLKAMASAADATEPF